MGLVLGLELVVELGPVAVPVPVSVPAMVLTLCNRKPLATGTRQMCWLPMGKHFHHHSTGYPDSGLSHLGKPHSHQRHTNRDGELEQVQAPGLALGQGKGKVADLGLGLEKVVLVVAGEVQFHLCSLSSWNLGNMQNQDLLMGMLNHLGSKSCLRIQSHLSTSQDLPQHKLLQIEGTRTHCRTSIEGWPPH